MTRFLSALVLAFCCACAFADQSAPTPLSPEQEQAALRSAEAAGLAVFRHDQAASVATDVALALKAFKKDRRIRGWVTEKKGGRILVTFIDETPAALYRVAVENGVAGPVEVLETPAALTPYEAAAARARNLVLARTFKPCASKYNAVVLPRADAAANDWLVYLLPAATRLDVIPLGGAYRMEVRDPDVMEPRTFTRPCISLHVAPGGTPIVTHLMDPVPTEVHVFWSLWARTELYVTTSAGLWKVEGSRISRVEDSDAGG